MNEEIRKFIPGFGMGLTRAAISHPFEILKIQSQLGKQIIIDRKIFKGISYSLFANGIERGVQFYFFNKFKSENKDRLNSALKSSIISTGISFPYNIILIKRIISDRKNRLDNNIFIKSGLLELSRNLMGSTIFLYSYDYYKSKIELFFIPPVLATTNVWLITYPIDTVKNQLINDGKIGNVRLLYKGIKYPLIRSLPSSIVGMYVYEKLLNYLK